MKIVVRFIASRSIIGWLIRFGTMSLFEHVEILSRDGQGWVGAHAWTGVEKRPLDWAGKLIRDYRYELEVTETQFKMFHGFVDGMIGTRYNYLLIAGLALHLRWLALWSKDRIDWSKGGYVDCSQLVIWALQRAGIQPLNAQMGFDGLVTPETLHLSPILIGRRIK